ncbi:MAG: neutral/alkaline non-lysosomal ceramidase N-terminal domain-containing protein [Bryobacterales bacterium]|nr:neutral/alkaline non-lysosomal ceramidase N-terminal domain-containing protein [Bryobacterales bacterium]
MRSTIALLLLAGSLSTAGAALRAGAAAVDITPRQWPVRLAGGFTPPWTDKVHDRLHVRTIVLDDGRTRIAIGVVDSCYVPGEVLDEAKALAHTRTGIPTNRMLLSATHTHSAPFAQHLNPSESEKAYTRQLIGDIAQSIERAHAALEPAQVAWTKVDIPDELFNRRWFLKEGTMPVNPFGRTDDKVKMNPGRNNLVKPAGGTDPEFSIVSLRTAAGKPLAVLGNYSLHYVGGVRGAVISADYFGEYARLVAERLAPGDAKFVGILSNGTSGDVNNNDLVGPPVRREPFEKIRIVAEKLAAATEKALKDLPHRGDLDLAMSERVLPLQWRKPDKEHLEWAKHALDEADQSKLPSLAKAYAERAVRLHQGPDIASVKLQTIRIGTLGIASIPAEVFTEIGLEIKEKSPLKPSFTIELANGAFGYLPTPEQHALGGYETWLGTNRLEIEASRKIVSALLEMFDEVKPRR